MIMELRSILTTMGFSAAIFVAASSAHADSTGFDSIHGKMRVGGKTCFVDHSHAGTGQGANRKVAEMRAISSWYGYTAGEYGSDWANINKAIKKSMRCAPSGGGWSCDVEATPCR
jgi:hypothetical protein